MRGLQLGSTFMAHPIVLSYSSSFLLALLISYVDPSSAIEATASFADDDCQHGECYGVDMLPEKFFDPVMVDHVHEVGSKSTNNADSGGDNNSGTEMTGDDNMRSPLEQMNLLVAKQRDQIEHLEHLTHKLQLLMDKLGTGVLHPPERTGVGSEIVRASLNGKSSGGIDIPSDGGVGSLQDHILTEGNGQKMEETKNAETSSLLSKIVDMHQKRPEHGYSGGITVARYKPAWSEHFQFLSAVKVDGEVTCLHVLPHEGEEGLSKYVAVGVDTGRVYIFLSHGDLLVDFQTVSSLPVTAILSFALRRNETTILTGHADGTVLAHKLWEIRHSGPSYGDEWSTLSMEHVKKLATPSSQTSTVDPTSANQEPVKQNTLQKSVKILEAYRVGKMRYILVANSEGNIEVFRDNGTFYGAVKTSSQPLAFLRSPNSQRLLFLTQDGVASLDLRSLAVRTGPCEGLDGMKVGAYAFDATGRSKAYGFTEEGHMVYVALSGDALHFECHVRSKRKLDMGERVVAQGIKGYLLAVTPTQVLVYNTTVQVGHAHNSISVGVPRLLFASPIDELSISFLNGPIKSISRPVIACNRERLVVLGFGDGYVGMYKSNLPVQRSGSFNSRTWTSPVIIIVLMLVGGWHFFGKKRDVSVPIHESEIALGSSSDGMTGYVKAGMDEPIDALADLRRYSSPAKAFPGSSTGGYSAGTLKYRSPVAEQSFRTPGESSFRGSTSVERNLRSSPLEPYFQQETAESNFRATKLETSFQNPLGESNSYLKRDLDLKAARGSSSLQPRIKSLQEPNSF
ncbi:hypothetical protein GOP47_0002264 [Adiantum capillus-veneris]|uniref:Uncharacterized protein n=1 Tax=Adiantum capillus-veneris TaxID=13818 RepID=A0A9D4VB90_ADICA|nr:hypothetical protein GOP47_0002264 [Adiantum capillus-veneris]